MRFGSGTKPVKTPAQQNLERWQQYIAVLGAIASDPVVPSDERCDALTTLDDIAAEARNDRSVEYWLLTTQRPTVIAPKLSWPLKPRWYS